MAPKAKARKGSKGSKSMGKKIRGMFSSSETDPMLRLFQMFDAYKLDSDKDEIGPDGVAQLCDDMGVDASNIGFLVLAYHLQAKRMGYFTREEFINGLTKLSCTTLEDLKRRIEVEFHEQLKDPKVFRKVYEYAFAFSKELPEHRYVTKSTAMVMQRMLLGADGVDIDTEYPVAQPYWDWLELADAYGQVNKDQWFSLLQFVRTYKDLTFEGYDDESSWPCMFDEFVESVREKQADAKMKE